MMILAVFDCEFGRIALNEHLANLLNGAADEDRERKRHAVLQIAMLLERSTHADQAELGREQERFYASIVPRHLMASSINRQEHEWVVERLSILVRAGKATPDMLWAIGKASPDVGIRPLLVLLGAYPVLLDDEAAYQALIALENFLVVDQGGLRPAIAQAILEHTPVPALERMRGGSTPRLAQQAASVLASLERKVPPQ